MDIRTCLRPMAADSVPKAPREWTPFVSSKASVLILATIGLLPVAGEAADPSSGTLQPGSTITYTAGPFAQPNPTPAPTDRGPKCNFIGYACDTFRLTVELPAGTMSAKPNLYVKVTLRWEDVTSVGDQGNPGDYDLWIYEGEVSDLDGSDPGLSSSASRENPEVATFVPKDGTVLYTVKIVPYRPNAGPVTVDISLTDVDRCPEIVSGSSAASLPASSDTPASGTTLSPGVARAFKTLSPASGFGAFVHFRAGTPADHRALLGANGLSVTADFEREASAVFAVGPLAGFRALRGLPSVSYIEENRRLRYFNDTAGWATHLRVAQEEVSGGPYMVQAGVPLKGDGVTVAVIDTGLNALHPDFAGRVLHNFKVTGDPREPGGAQVIETNSCAGASCTPSTTRYTNSDTASGHGTHVAGIAVGSGDSSSTTYYVNDAAPLIRGTFAGAASQAGLIAYGVGESPDPSGASYALLLYVNAALQHLHDKVDKGLQEFGFKASNVRVVNLSVGDEGGTPYNPYDVSSCLVKALVKKRVNVVFAAGNGGGNGSADTTSSFCKDPTPGVICVANYDDAGTGSLAGGLAGNSSRGPQGQPEWYPDIAAPGTDITSTCLQGTPGQYSCSLGVETRWQPYYGTMSGTSMAAAHVAGAIALMAQANADPEPAEIEAAIQDSARKIGSNGAYDPDPQNPGGTTNFGFGAGLLDVPAALSALNVKTPVKNNVVQHLLIAGDTESPSVAGAADLVQLTVQETTPPAEPGAMYRLEVGDALQFGVSESVTYQLRQNVNGKPFRTAIRMQRSGPTIPGPGSDNTAPASSVMREGNVITFVVPYARLGHPPVDAPVHNLTLRSSDENGVLDYAPSAEGNDGSHADTEPLLAKPFSVTLSSGDPLANGPCDAPGVQVIVDPSGDVSTGGLATGQDDLQYVAIGEPGGLDNKLVFTIKVDNLEVVPPGHSWITYFKAPGGVEYWVGMSSVNGSPQFSYGTTEVVDGAGGPNRVFHVSGALDPASNYGADGTISLILDKATIGLGTGAVLTGIVAVVRQSSPDPTIPGSTVDSAAATLGYTLVGNGCPVSVGGGGGGGGGGFLSAFDLATLIALAFGGLAGNGFRCRRRARRQASIDPVPREMR